MGSSGALFWMDIGFYVRATLWVLLESLYGIHARHPEALCSCIVSQRCDDIITSGLVYIKLLAVGVNVMDRSAIFKMHLGFCTGIIVGPTTVLLVESSLFGLPEFTGAHIELESLMLSVCGFIGLLWQKQVIHFPDQKWGPRICTVDVKVLALDVVV